MVMRYLSAIALSCALNFPVAAYAQGELSQCRSYEKEFLYPCILSGAVVRSKRDHLLQARALDRTGETLDQSVLDRRPSRDIRAQDVLRLLLDK